MLYRSVYSTYWPKQRDTNLNTFSTPVKIQLWPFFQTFILLQFLIIQQFISVCSLSFATFSHWWGKTGGLEQLYLPRSHTEHSVNICKQTNRSWTTQFLTNASEYGEREEFPEPFQMWDGYSEFSLYRDLWPAGLTQPSGGKAQQT